jgi:hypothetical protein
MAVAILHKIRTKGRLEISFCDIEEEEEEEDAFALYGGFKRGGTKQKE